MSTAGCGFASKLACSIKCSRHLSSSSDRTVWVQAVSAEQQQRIAGALVDALTDKDTGVSCDAAAALQSYGSNEQGVLNAHDGICRVCSRDPCRHAISVLALSICHCDVETT